MSLDTMFLAQLIGVYMLVAGVSGLLYPGRMRKAMEEFARSKILPFFDGTLALILGLVIVLLHNDWSTLASSLVSLVGWLALVEGFAMLLLPEQTIANFTRSMSSSRMGRVFALVAVVVGVYLVYVGFVV